MNTYTVLMLGGRESGKTVFLACMAKKLSTYNKEIGFFLNVEEHDQLIKLNNLYNAIYPGLKEKRNLWTPGTLPGAIDNFTFTCKIETSEDVYSVCQFQYLDYAGGTLTKQGIDRELDEKIKNADSLLVLLDGTKLISYINNEDEGIDWYAEDIANIIPKLTQTKKPVIFSISKWDVVKRYYNLNVKRYYNLKMIKEKLLNDQQFKNLVDNRTVRLIPISSVGDGFAEWQSDENGEMKMQKVGENPPNPFQVEMPLACILFDMVEQKIRDLEQEREEEAKKNTNVDPSVGIFDWIKAFAGRTATEILKNFSPENKFDDYMLKTLIDAIEKNTIQSIEDRQRYAEQRTKQLKNEQQQLLEEINSEQTAFESLIASFNLLIDKLEKEFPESTLSKSIDSNKD